MTRIETEQDLDQALASLAALCPLMAATHARLGSPPLRRRPPGFAGLIHIVTYQQISTSAALAIWTRMETVFGTLTPERMLAATEDEFRLAGQSGPKIRTIRAIAAAVADGSLDLEATGQLEADAAHAALVKVKGIGPWTADVYLLSCLGHADAWPAGDIALQAGAATLLTLPSRPDAKDMAVIGERWRPYRAVAARLLWALYAAKRTGGGGQPLAT